MDQSAGTVNPVYVKPPAPRRPQKIRANAVAGADAVRLIGL